MDLDSAPPSSPSPPFSVITIHGTWAQNAPWTKDDSLLSHHLHREFGQQVQLLNFDWSGKNSWASRIDASKKLNQFISSTLIDKSIPYFLIAHSHGGNIAIGATTVDLDKKPDGIICLNTPFLQPIYRSLATTRRFALALSAPILLGFIYLYFNLHIGGNQILSTLTLAIGSFFAVYLPQLFCAKVISQGEADNFVSSWYKSSSLKKQPILCLHSMDDEPADLMRLVRSTADTIFQVLAHIRGSILTAICIGLSIAIYKGWLRPPPIMDSLLRKMADPIAAADNSFNFLLLWKQLDLSIGIQLSVGGAAEYLTWASAIVAVLALVISWVADHMVFGIPLTITSLALPLRARLLVGAAPPAGNIDVVYLDQDETKRDRLRHSEIYQSDEALNQISNWIRERLAKQNIDGIT